MVLLKNPLIEPQSLFYGCDILEMHCIRYFEALHTISVPPLLKVLLKSLLAPIAGTATDLALVFHAQAMQLKQPVRNGFAVPPNRKILRIMLNCRIVITVGVARARGVEAAILAIFLAILPRILIFRARTSDVIS